MAAADGLSSSPQTMTRAKEDEVDYGDMPNHLGYHIRRTHSYFSRVFTHYGKMYGIKSQQTTILALTQRNPGISPATIADSNSMERSLMAKLTADLEERGFIERRPSELDKRHKGLFITKAGDKFLAEILNTFTNEVEPRISRNLSAGERKTLIRLLQKVYRD